MQNLHPVFRYGDVDILKRHIRRQADVEIGIRRNEPDNVFDMESIELRGIFQAGSIGERFGQRAAVSDAFGFL